MENLFRRVMSLLLVISMLVTPLTAFANSETEDEEEELVAALAEEDEFSVEENEIEEFVEEEEFFEEEEEEVILPEEPEVEEPAEEPEEEEIVLPEEDEVIVPETPVEEVPAEEVPVEEIPTEEPPMEEPKPEETKAVTVLFQGLPEAAEVTVIAAEDPEQKVIEAELDGSYLLIPGKYIYSVACEGFQSIVEEELTVEAAEEPMIVPVELMAVVTDTASAVSGKTITYTDGGFDWVMDKTTFAVTVSGSGDVTSYPSDLDADKVTSLNFRAGVEDIAINLYAFPNVTTVILPSTATGTGYFTDGSAYMPKLRYIEVSSANPNFATDNNVLFSMVDGEADMLLLCPPAKTGSYTLPSTGPFSKIKEVGDFAFFHSKLSSVDLTGAPKLDTFNHGAFMMAQLTSFKLPAKVTTIPNHCFYGCKYLTSFTGHSDLEDIGIGAFQGCSALTSFPFNGGLVIIDENAFKESGIKTAVLPDGITNLGSGAFEDCTQLTKVHIPDSVTEITAGTFAGCEALASIRIPQTITKIGPNAFYGCTGLTEVIFGGDAVAWKDLIDNNTDATGNDALRNHKLKDEDYQNGITIIYDLDGGKNDPKNPSAWYNKAQTFTLLAGTKQGYEFDYWEDTDKSTKVTAINAVTTSNYSKDLNLKAHWKLKQYKITYSYNGAEAVDTNPTTYTIEDTLNASTPLKDYLASVLSDPTRDGYTGAGWYTNFELTKKLEDLDEDYLGNIALYYKWEADSYLLTMYYNDGRTNDGLSRTYTAEDSIVFPTNPARAGYTFKGWYDKDQGNDNAKVRISVPFGTTKNTTVYAHWTPIKYTITYMMDGGKRTSEYPDVYTAEDTFDFTDTTAFPTPTKKGYTFLGWFEDSRFEHKIEKIEKGSSGKINMYAKWSRNTYKLTMDPDNGEAISAKNFTVDSAFTLPTPKKTGYKFVCWFDTSAPDVRYNKIVAGTTGNLDLKAKWQPIEYTITYHHDGGTIKAYTEPLKTTYTVEDSPYVLATEVKAVRNGYHLSYWCTDSLKQKKITEIDPAAMIAADQKLSNIDLYPKWTANVYTVTFNANAADVVDPQPITYKITEAKSLPQPTRKGYTFAGWYDTDGVKVPSIVKGMYGDLTLKAKWTAVKYTVTYNLGGGTNSDVNPTKVTLPGTASGITLQPATRKGYTFAGWYDADKNKITELKDISKNQTLTAKWKLIDYLLTYEGNGATTCPANRNFTIKDSFTLATPKKTGYTFAGWYKDAGFVYKITSIASGTAKDLTVYAKWTPKTYTISYVLNGGTNVDAAPKKFTIEKAKTLTDPIRKGYSFDGWFYDKALTVPVTGNKIPAGTHSNQTVYAKWTANKYNVTYTHKLPAAVIGDVVEAANPTTYKISTSYTLKNPSLKGYTFKGWYIQGTDVKVTKLSDGRAKNMTLEGRWSANKYTVTYNLNGGKANASENTKHTTRTILTDYVLQDAVPKSGKTFRGWFTNSNWKLGTQITNLNEIGAKNITLYASWY